MNQRPWYITLMFCAKFIHVYTEVDVCHEEYDMKRTCLDCCYGTPLNTYSNVKSATACGNLCSKVKKCQSFQYDPIKKECWTNGENMTTVNTSCPNLIRYGELQLGSCPTLRVVEMCSSDADCVTSNSSCRNGSCHCKDGHPYDYQSDSCATGCTVYGNTFHEVYYFIPARNNFGYIGITSEECKARCLATTEFVCRLVEYDEDTTICSHSEINAVTFTKVEPIFRATWKTWDRNCA